MQTLGYHGVGVISETDSETEPGSARDKLHLICPVLVLGEWKDLLGIPFYQLHCLQRFLRIDSHLSSTCTLSKQWSRGAWEIFLRYGSVFISLQLKYWLTYDEYVDLFVDCWVTFLLILTNPLSCRLKGKITDWLLYSVTKWLVDSLTVLIGGIE